MAQFRDGGDSHQQFIEPKKGASKPMMFTGKAKLNLGTPADVNTKQNYDYSSMNRAAATTKVHTKEGEDGQAADGEKR